MPYGFVIVHGPPGRDVYINEGYWHAAGQIGPDGFTVEPIPVPFGENLFETLNGTRQPDHRCTCTVNEDGPEISVTLVAL